MSIIKENTHLHQDIDECLVAAIYCGSDKKRAEEWIEKYSDYESHIAVFGGGGWSGDSRSYYATFLRKGAWEHVDWCRNLVGEENYHILTNASYEWAVMANNVYGLGFPLENIFSREEQHLTVTRFKGANNVLIDNENWDYHWKYSNKNKFLDNLPVHKLFQVDDFYISQDDEQDKTDEYVKSWREGIIETINL